MVKKFGYGAKDEVWIPRAAEYGYIHITMDRNQLSDERVAKALHRSRARALFLPSRFSKANRWDQALWLLKHWHRITAATANMPRGEVRFARWDGRVTASAPKHRKVQRPKQNLEEKSSISMQLTLMD